ncbi:MAG: VWA domain-containing protein [Promethearchaeota archaeon]|nr:MAG: VWA domain-containing protein [Candidatus Lokiarchaeota archaeon]
MEVEDTVILVDSSRSMLRADFKPNRLTVALNTAKYFIEQKFSIDPKDRICLLTFGDSIKEVTPFTYDSERLILSMRKSQIKISGLGDLESGLSFALQLLIEEMQKIGGKVSRAFIITDNKFTYTDKIEKIINAAKGLGVFIDSCQLGLTQDFTHNILKRISKLTKGEFGFFKNPTAAINAGKHFASKKDTDSAPDYLSSSQKKNKAPLLSSIALPLRRPSITEIRLMYDDPKKNEKCQICHSKLSPVTNEGFLSEGGFCPSCGKPMHLSCATMWAQKTEGKSNIFRCPFCYFLLRIPQAYVNIVHNNKKKAKQKIEPKTTEMIPVAPEKVNEIDASCSYCHNIFLGEYRVYQCKNCKSYYHEPCLKKMFNEIRACRYCGYLLSEDPFKN